MRTLVSLKTTKLYMSLSWLGLETALGKRESPSLLIIANIDWLNHRLAWVEMKMVLAKVLWNYDLELSEKMMEGDWTDQKVYLLNEKTPMYVKMRPRV